MKACEIFALRLHWPCAPYACSQSVSEVHICFRQSFPSVLQALRIFRQELLPESGLQSGCKLHGGSWSLCQYSDGGALMIGQRWWWRSVRIWILARLQCGHEKWKPHQRGHIRAKANRHGWRQWTRTYRHLRDIFCYRFSLSYTRQSRLFHMQVKMFAISACVAQWPVFNGQSDMVLSWKFFATPLVAGFAQTYACETAFRCPIERREQNCIEPANAASLHISFCKEMHS